MREFTQLLLRALGSTGQERTRKLFEGETACSLAFMSLLVLGGDFCTPGSEPAVPAGASYVLSWAMDDLAAPR